MVFGLAHLFYLAPTAELVPTWLPLGQKFWAYATAAAHVAAGIAFLSGVAVRPAAMWLTAMFVVFGVLVHAPTIFFDPHTHINWAAERDEFCLDRIGVGDGCSSWRGLAWPQDALTSRNSTTFKR